jgi:hypothetical protein
MLAYDTAGRGYEKSRERLARFYVRNGFYAADGGMYWNRIDANLETKSDKQLVVDGVIAQGSRYSVGDLLDTYLKRMVTTKSFKESFSEKEQALIESYMSLKNEAKILEGESNRYSRTLQEYEHQQRMAAFESTETVGL